MSASITIDQLAALSAEGLTADQIVRVVSILLSADTPAGMIEARREKDRKRKALKRSEVTSDIADKPEIVRDLSADTKNGGVVLPSFLPSLDSGKKELEIQHARDPVPVPLDETAMVVTVWNETAGDLGLPKVQHLTPARRKAIAKRLIEAGGIEGVRYAMTKIRESPGLQGKAGGRKWRANFDWFLQPSSFTKLMEGGYDHWQKPRSDLMEAADRLVERAHENDRRHVAGGGSSDGLFDGIDGSSDLLDGYSHY